MTKDLALAMKGKNMKREDWVTTDVYMKAVNVGLPSAPMVRADKSTGQAAAKTRSEEVGSTEGSIEICQKNLEESRRFTLSE